MEQIFCSNISKKQVIIFDHLLFCSRISQGIREAKKNGAQIGHSKGTCLTTKKSLQCKAIIQKHSKDFGGSLEDSEVIKLCGCSRNSYYKYKKTIKETAY